MSDLTDAAREAVHYLRVMAERMLAPWPVGDDLASQKLADIAARLERAIEAQPAPDAGEED